MPYSGKFLRVLIFVVFVGQSETTIIATMKIIYLKGVTLFQGRSLKFKMQKVSAIRQLVCLVTHPITSRIHTADNHHVGIVYVWFTFP